MADAKPTNSKTVTVSILDKSYQVNCKAEEVSALQKSADFLDRKMREMKENSNVFGLDRLAVMAALNITNELLAQTDKATQLDVQTNGIAHIADKVDSAILRLKEASQ